MFDKNQKLEISPGDLAIIEDALETKRKILKIQAAAGGEAALDRLNAVKQTLALLAQHRPKAPARRRGFGLRRLSRLFG